MRRAKYYVLDVFTDQPLAGNPLAVFPDRSELREDELQRIARELNLSETVFVEESKHEEALCRLRIFTPASELPLAGHPVVGTWYLLASRGLVDLSGASISSPEGGEGGREVLQFKHELGVGVLPMTIYRTRGEIENVVMDQAKPEFGEEIRDLGLPAKALGVTEDSIRATGLWPQVVNTGGPIMMVPLAERGSLSSVRLHLAAMGQLCNEEGCGGLYAFTLDAFEEWASVRARGFFPELGVTEDPATGSAAGCLGSYMAKHKVFGDGPTISFQIEQGYEAGRPSRIGVEVTKEGDEITRVLVAGTAVVVAEAEMMLPS